MEFLTTLLIVIIVAFVYKKLKSKGENRPFPQVPPNGLKMTNQEISGEARVIEEELRLAKQLIKESGLIKEEKIGQLLKALEGSRSPFERLSLKPITDGEPYLTIEEKNKLGLNSRMKYSKQFIDYFRIDALPNIEPKSAINNICLDAWHRAHRQGELDKLKRMGFVSHVKIMSCDDGDDCKQVKKFKGKYPLDRAPELPLKECDATYCRCWYEPVIKT